MFRSILIPVLILAGFGCSQQLTSETTDEITQRLDSLFEAEEFFKLRDYYPLVSEDLNRVQQLYYQAIIDNCFFRHEESNRKLILLLEKNRLAASLEKKKVMHHVKYMNHYNLFQYRLALKENEILTGEYRSLLDSVVYKNLVNERKLLTALEAVSPQEITKSDDSRIALIRDKMGLLNVPLSIGGETYDFLFDTGSSFSFIRRSIAEKSGYEIHDIDFEVEGATGAVVLCDLVVMGRMEFGNMEILNSVFWVMEDSDLTLPEYDYSVNGAIAFPILKSMDEIHIHFTDSITVPEIPQENTLENLAIDQLDPVIAVIQDNDTLPYYFDTGSAFSSLYKPYYTKNKERIDSSFDQHSFNIGSIGGVKEFTCYIIDSMDFSVSGEAARVFNIETHTKSIYNEPEKVYGNLGQDFIMQFDEMVINTKFPAVFFRNDTFRGTPPGK